MRLHDGVAAMTPATDYAFAAGCLATVFVTSALFCLGAILGNLYAAWDSRTVTRDGMDAAAPGPSARESPSPRGDGPFSGGRG
jgi:hypothetical protein